MVSINDTFVVRAFVTKKGRFYDYADSEIHINGAFYEAYSEHIDEGLYWLFENLEKLVFLLNTKKNKVKAIQIRRFEKKKEKFLAKSNIRIFTVLGRIN